MAGGREKLATGAIDVEQAIYLDKPFLSSDNSELLNLIRHSKGVKSLHLKRYVNSAETLGELPRQVIELLCSTEDPESFIPRVAVEYPRTDQFVWPQTALNKLTFNETFANGSWDYYKSATTTENETSKSDSYKIQKKLKNGQTKTFYVEIHYDDVTPRKGKRFSYYSY